MIMTKRAKHIFLWIIVIIIAIVVAIYFSVPLVRYLALPITGSTKAPSLSFGTSKPSPSKQFVAGTLANATQVVNTIAEVPEEGGWINTSPLDLKALQQQNKVILIDFWTYTCINCIRATPYTEELWKRYKDYGLVVIGVHSPEFSVERNPANILKAVKQLGITYPVLTDADHLVWNAFGNHFWPAIYVISPKGEIVYTKFGEGHYANEEDALRRALEKAGWKLPLYGPPTKFLTPLHTQQTEELYAGLGFVRRSFGNPNQPALGQVVSFKLPMAIDQDRIYLSGQWKGDYDYIESESPGEILLKYLASTPYVVLGPANEAVMVVVRWDGKSVPKQYQGSDIKTVNGKTIIRVDSPRLYYPLNSKAPYGTHKIEFSVPKGLRLWSFTFGSYVLR